VVPEPPLTSRETPSSKRRGSADSVENALGRLEFRAVSTDLVRTELASHDVKTHKIISLLMPELPKKGSGSTLSFNVGDYAIHHLLGKGGSGSVYLGSHLRTKELVVRNFSFFASLFKHAHFKNDKWKEYPVLSNNPIFPFLA